MFKNLFEKIDVCFNAHDQKITPEEKFFSNVVGYTELKRFLLRSIVSKEPVNILLTGPPSSSKTVFLLEMLRGLGDSFFVDGTGASGPGMMEYLFTNDVKYLLIDEIDKIKRNDQAVLLNIMETGILSETKLKGKTRQKRMKLWIFATSNDVEKLSEALRSRFMELHFEEYSYDEFLEIVRRLLKKKYRLDEKLSEKIGFAVWHQLKSKDIRDAINIAKLTKSSADVDWLVDVQVKYSKKMSLEIE